MLKTKAVFLTDTHLKKDNLDLVERIFIEAFELCISENCKTLIHGGDWFTNRTGQNLQTLLRMKRILQKSKNYGIEIIGINGNHDKTDLDSESSYMDVYSGFSNFKLMRKEGFIEYGDLVFCFLSFFSSSYKSRLDKLKDEIRPLKGKKILFTHSAVDGVMNNDGSLVEDGLTPKKFSIFHKVLVGHYHDASEIGKNIIYTGSAYQSNYGENISDKGFTLVKEDGSLEHVKSTFPKYIKIKIDASDSTAIKNELEFHETSKGDNIRFIFQGKKTDIDKINLSEFTDLGIDCKFECEEINSEITKSENIEFTQIDSKQMVKNFFDYCKLQSVSPEQRKFGMKFLKDESSS